MKKTRKIRRKDYQKMLRKGRQVVENARLREMEAILRGDVVIRDSDGKYLGSVGCAAKWAEAVIAGHLTGKQLELWRKKMAKIL